LLAHLHVPDWAAHPGVTSPITSLAHSPSSHGLSLTAEGRYGEIHLEGGPSPLTLATSGKVTSLEFSPSGSFLLSASGISGLRGEATLWNPRQGTIVRTFSEDHRDMLYDATFSPDETLIATAGYDRRIHIWEVATGRLHRTITGHNGAVFDLAFSPDGSLLASASADQTGKIWRVSDGVRLDTLNEPEAEVNQISFTPDGTHILAAGADHRIYLWKAISRTEPRINPLIHARFAHEDEILAFALDPSGGFLTTASTDGTVKRWTVPDLILQQTWSDQPLISALTPSSHAASLNGTIKHYPASSEAVEEDPASQHTMLSSPASAVDRQLRTIEGTIDHPGKTDDHVFQAKAGETVILEVNAARSKSPLDSKLQILYAETGAPVERVILQATRDSWFTFRGKDAKTTDDFRVHNQSLMEINELLYANGEVVQLYHYPRGPDSGFKVYPGRGSRTTLFDTTPLAHALGQPCYIVTPHPAGTDVPSNGLPTWTLYYENDDDAQRRFGSDSRLTFTAPQDGSYLARVSDVRGFSGPDSTYTLTIRSPDPHFTVSVKGKDKISPGSGKELEVNITRIDGFEEEIELTVTGLPPGFTATSTSVQPGHTQAIILVSATPNATLSEGAS
ncbi:MAG: WD40 repeat domain-containing protein, partial [Verrucomicrobiota bacterium]